MFGAASVDKGASGVCRHAEDASEAGPGRQTRLEQPSHWENQRRHSTRCTHRVWWAAASGAVSVVPTVPRVRNCRSPASPGHRPAERSRVRAPAAVAGAACAVEPGPAVPGVARAGRPRRQRLATNRPLLAAARLQRRVRGGCGDEAGAGPRLGGGWGMRAGAGRGLGGGPGRARRLACRYQQRHQK
jgi:hypothetical protein